MGELQGEFRLNSPFEPAGDQPEAIEALVEGFKTKSQQVPHGSDWLRENIHDGECYPAHAKTNSRDIAQQDVGCTALFRIQGILSA